MSDTVAIVTGAGGGIGAGCAMALARSRTVFCVDLARERADATSAAIQRAGGRAESVAADAGEPDFAARVLAAVTRAGVGTVSAVVHAVAYEEHVSAEDLTAASFLRSITVGPMAAFSLFRELLAGGALAPGAALTAIGSLHASLPFARCLGYNAAHGALAQVVRTLAHEWAGRGVRVNAVVPGWIRTPGEVTFYGGAALDAAATALPMRRFGTGDDVAAAVDFLSSERASYISGAFLTVDGALTVSLARLPEGGSS
jgi:NAD(P)-dependent dehydrogenase (short-subunit alcohol dehydrogenase family)